tara:strand:+ start:2842 stop:3075 length:234 start_codon:yes stop_codon:yes gene_type:complete
MKTDEATYYIQFGRQFEYLNKEWRRTVTFRVDDWNFRYYIEEMIQDEITAAMERIDKFIKSHEEWIKEEMEMESEEE